MDFPRVQTQAEFTQHAQAHRRELRVHCYRMLGSIQDAEDLVQETLLRAWQKLETYEGRASFRAWLYKIATNACLDTLDRRPRRVLPQARQPASDPHGPPGPPVMEPIWLEPIPDDLLADVEAGPDKRYEARETISLAFLAALQVLPPRQRAVLILRDVLDWHAEETATLLDLSLPAVNSALHRARTSMAKYYRRYGLEGLSAPLPDEEMSALLARYVHAWENTDLDELISLLKEEATFPMPPVPDWYQGKDAIRAFVSTIVMAGVTPGTWHFEPVRANGQPAFGWYRLEDGVYRPFAIQVVTVEGNLIADITTFMNPALFPWFGLRPKIAA
ncbi:MAG: sigma-70 family RNA polymerase sigma factor [Anaerolineae bacterium]